SHPPHLLRPAPQPNDFGSSSYLVTVTERRRNPANAESPPAESPPAESPPAESPPRAPRLWRPHPGADEPGASDDPSLCVKTSLRAASVIYMTSRDLVARIVLWVLAVRLWRCAPGPGRPLTPGVCRGCACRRLSDWA